MKKLFSLALMVALMLGCNAQVNGQDAASTDETRHAQIISNLKIEFPQLEEYEVVIDEIKPSGIAGLEEGTFTIAGQQKQAFLITPDNTKLYLLAADAIDASRTAEDIARVEQERKEAEMKEANERHTALLDAIAGLPVRGNPNAPITVVEFSDFQCPYCARGFSTMEQLVEKYPNDVRFVYVHFPLPNHPWAKPAAIASVCAAQQDDDAFWALHDHYFENQRQYTLDNVIAKSQEVLAGTDVDVNKWLNCASNNDSQAYKGAAAAVDGWMSMGRKYGVSGTPAFFVNGVFLSGAQPLDAFEEIMADIQNGAADDKGDTE